jgi:hypothetical protein
LHWRSYLRLRDQGSSAGESFPRFSMQKSFFRLRVEFVISRHDPAARLPFDIQSSYYLKYSSSESLHSSPRVGSPLQFQSVITTFLSLYINR